MDLPQDFIDVLNAVTNKRARFVIDTILKNGYCSTEDLKNGGYEHAPRAARDVRELGIPLQTFKIKDSAGKNIAAYKFGDWEEAKRKNQLLKTSGRTQLTEKLKNALLERYGARCNLYGEKYPAKLLQPDHRIPYELPGNIVAVQRFFRLRYHNGRYHLLRSELFSQSLCFLPWKQEISYYRQTEEKMISPFCQQYCSEIHNESEGWKERDRFGAKLYLS